MVENKRIITAQELDKILSVTRFQESAMLLSEVEKEEMLTFFQNKGFGFQQVFSFIAGAKRKAILQSTDGNLIILDIIDLIRNHSSNEEMRSYTQLNSISQQLRAYVNFYNQDLKEKSRLGDITQDEYNEKKLAFRGLDDLILLLLNKIRERNSLLGFNCQEYSEEELSQLFYTACIYNTINSNLRNLHIENDETAEPVRVADEIVINFLEKIKSNKKIELNKELSLKFGEFISTLTSPRYKQVERFSPTELYSLLSKTPSLIYGTTAKDVLAIINKLNEFTSLITAQDRTKTLTTNFINTKSIIMKSPSLLSTDGQSFGEAIDLLSGKTVGEIISSNPKYNETKESFEPFEDLHIEFIDSASFVDLMTNNPSFLSSFNLNSFLNTAKTLIDTLYSALSKVVSNFSPKATIKEKVASLSSIGLDINSIITSNNIIEIIKNTKSSENLASNISILSSVLSIENLEKVIKTNYLLLLQSPSYITDNINKIKRNSYNRNEFTAQIKEFVNNKLTAIKKYNPVPAIKKEVIPSDKQAKATEIVTNAENQSLIKHIIGEETSIEEIGNRVWKELLELDLYTYITSGQHYDFSPNSLAMLLVQMSTGSLSPMMARAKFKKKVIQLNEDCLALQKQGKISREFTSKISQILRNLPQKVEFLTKEIDHISESTSRFYQTRGKRTLIDTSAEQELTYLEKRIKELSALIESGDVVPGISHLQTRLARLKGLARETKLYIYANSEFSKDIKQSRQETLLNEQLRLGYKLELEQLTALTDSLRSIRTLKNETVKKSKSRQPVQDIERLRILYENATRSYTSIYRNPELDNEETISVSGFKRDLWLKWKKRKEDYELALSKIETTTLPQD